ncbi:MAG: amidohydrolase, partial [Pyrinomonadaceae bacterium]
MKVLAALLVSLISAFEFSPAPARVPPADLVFKNGNIYTANERQPRAEAVAVKGDRIIFVGSNRDAQNYVGKNTRVVDLRGRTMVPGMTDAHHHLSGVGFREMTLNLEGLR